MSITFVALDHQEAFKDVFGMNAEQKAQYLDGLLAGAMGVPPDRLPEGPARSGASRGIESRGRYEAKVQSNSTTHRNRSNKDTSNPKWQALRLRAMERDGFACKTCGKSDSTLHVHHLKYVDGGKIWDSPVEDLVTLCESCHGHAHGKKP